jgi:uncharacterized membrane protein
MDELIHPNWHVILLHYPLGLLTLGIVIELFACCWKASSVRIAGRWMILLGALLCLPALTTGIGAFADAARGASANKGQWQDVVSGSRWGAQQWEFMKLHLLLMSSSAGLILAAVLAWIGCSDHWRDRLRWAFLAALIIAMGGMVVGAWFGGEGVYRYAVAVQPQTTPNAAVGGTEATPKPAPTVRQWLSSLRFDPVQTHLLLAGFTVALAVGAIGLTIRRWTLGPRLIAEEPAGAGEIERRLAEPPAPAAESDRIPLEDPGMPLETRENLPGVYREEPVLPRGGGPGVYQTTAAEPPAVFAARWWVLTALLALLTGLGGLWLVEGLDWRIPETRELVQKAFSPAGRVNLNADSKHMLIHLILAISIFLLPLILALITRFSKRLLWVTTIGLVLLAAAVGVQVWMGVLLLYGIG